MPQRFLRPGLTTSDRWNAASFPAQSLYVRILTLVDDWGRYDARIPILHAHCFALRSDIKPQQTAALRTELTECGLIRVYTVDGKEFLEVERWQERKRGERSKFPDPQDSAADGSGAQEKDASLAIATTPSPLHQTPAVRTMSHSPQPVSDEDWLKQLQTEPCYAHIRVRDEHGKMCLWCRQNKRPPTRKRFLAWLNRIEPPMSNGNGTAPVIRKREIPERFRSHLLEKYPDKRDTIAGWRTWDQLPNWTQGDWTEFRKGQNGST